MIKIVKLGVWFIVGAGSIGALLGNTNFHTPWKYTVHSTIAPGTQITLTPSEGEPMVMSVAEGQTISSQKTLDVGAPLILIGIYVLGSFMAFGLKAKHRGVSGRQVCGGREVF